MSLSLIAQSYKIEEDSDHREDDDDTDQVLGSDLSVDNSSEHENSIKVFDSVEDSQAYNDENECSDALTNESESSPPPTLHREEDIDTELVGANRKPVLLHQDAPNDSKDDVEDPHSQVDSFKCPFCLIQFEGNILLIRHLRITHPGMGSIFNQDVDNAQQSKITKSGATKVKNEIRPSKPPTSSNNGNRLTCKDNKNKSGKCSQCGYTSTKWANFQRHMKTHTETKRPFPCPQCPSFFLSLAALGMHENMAHNREKGVTKVSCKTCGKRMRPHQLPAHIRTHAKGKQFACSFCDKKYWHVGHLQTHITLTHGTEATDTTSVIEKPALNPSSVTHEERETDKNDARKRAAFKCPYCFNIFVHRAEFLEHLRIHKKGEGNPESSLSKKNAEALNKGPSYTKCQPCSLSFASITHLQRHVKIHDERSRTRHWKCTQCNSYFTNVVTLRKHENRIHNRKVGPTPCPYKTSGKLFWSRSSLAAHVGCVYGRPSKHSSNQNRNDPSQMSDAYFMNKFKLQPCKVHLTRCDGLIPDAHSKTECRNSNISSKPIDNPGVSEKNKTRKLDPNDSLIMIRKVSGEKTKFECKIYREPFSKRGFSLRHIRNHTREGPHRCPDCSKTFLWKSYLDRHRRIHGGMKAFNCSICSRSFHTVQALADHSPVHTGERAFQCPHCPSGFKFRSNL